jgi:carbon-monoxide dehydrogenase large subunit
MNVDNWHLKERVGRLVRGEGRYLDDIKMSNMLYCCLVNSPYSHAIIKSVDVSKALKIPGVKYVLTGKMLTQLMNPLPALADFSETMVWRNPSTYPLAVDRVRFYGEPVAAVVAEDRYTAQDACDNIEVGYQPLQPVVTIEDALKPDAPLLYPEWGSNIQAVFKYKSGNVENAFAYADKIVEFEFKEARQSGFPLEPRGVIAFYDKYQNTYTVYSSTQSPTLGRWVIAKSLNIPEGNVKVFAPDVGGGFGNKVNFTLDILACVLSKQCNSPVKLVENRYQNIVMGPHQRDVYWKVKAAVSSTGIIHALKATLYVDLGVEGNVRGVGAPSIIPAALSCVGAYKIGAVDVEANGVVTNKSFYDAYRGYGKDKGAKMIERLMDVVARKIGLSPEEIRMRNFIQPSEFPYTQITGYIYDSGNYPQLLKKAAELIKIEEWRKKKTEFRAKGRYIGIGISLTLEPAGGAIANTIYTGYESVRARISEDGTVEVYSGWMDIGQGSVATMAQITSEMLGVRLEDVKVYTGSSDYMGSGPWASRGAVYSASAIVKAMKLLREKLVKIGAHIFECRAEDIEISDSQIYVKDNPDKKITLKQLCHMLYFKGQQRVLNTELMKEGVVPLDVTVTWFSPLTAEKKVTYTTVSASADACVVEVDPETGRVNIIEYVSVHDCGKIINHKIVEGQVFGGLAQAIGSALYEEVVYDKNGVALTSSFMDYHIPSSLEMNFPIKTDYMESPSPFTELGSKGVGEAPSYSGTVTVANAVEDALEPFNVTVDSVPITPWKVLSWIK